MTHKIEQQAAERKAGYTQELGALALKVWRLQKEIDGTENRIRLLTGAEEEGEQSRKDLDTLKACVVAETKAEAEGREVAGERPATAGPVVPIEEVRRAKKLRPKTPKKG